MKDTSLVVRVAHDGNLGDYVIISKLRWAGQFLKVSVFVILKLSVNQKYTQIYDAQHWTSHTGADTLTNQWPAAC